MPHESLFQGRFGSCCNDLHEALNPEITPNPLLMISEQDVLYLTIGMVETQDGPGFFDQAIMFCPFCGRKLQDRAEIDRKVDG